MNKYKIIKKVIARIDLEEDLKKLIKSLSQGLINAEDYILKDKEDKEYLKQFKESSEELISLLENILEEKDFNKMSHKYFKKVMKIFKGEEKLKNKENVPSEIAALLYWHDKDVKYF